MELFEAILSRRTIKDFTSQPVSTEGLERALTAGLWAQNHRLTQPWRFTILGPATRQALAAAAADARLATLSAADDDDARARVRASAEQKILSKPSIVAVSSVLAADQGQWKEDYAAVCCAIQNIQLAAWAEGLGMQWSTSKLISHPATYQLLEINPAAEEIVALLYFGYPAVMPAAVKRKPLSEVSRWMR